MKPKPWQILSPDNAELRDNALSVPLRARNPWRYRVAGDLFASLPFESIAAVLGVVAACPRHEFEVETVSVERMGEFFAWVKYAYGEDRMCPAEGCRHEALERTPGAKEQDGRWSKLVGPLLGYDMRWPLPNLRLLTHVTTQAEADARIPALLACPSAWRGVEVTPGERIELADYLTEFTGDCGCSACKEGSTCGKGREVVPPLDLVTVRGGTAPLHPNHVRDIRDQCAAARVPFRFEGWGEWCPREHPYVIDDDVPRVRLTICGCNGQSDIARHGVRGSYTSAHECDTSNDSWMNKVGVARSGRLLDGVTHDGEVANG